VISVENDRDVVQSSDFTDMLGGGDTSGNASSVVSVVSGLSSHELTTSLGEGHHDWTSVLLCGLHTRVDGVATTNIHSWNGESGFLGVVKKVNKGLSGDNTRLDRSWQLSESLETRKTVSVGSIERRNKLLIRSMTAIAYLFGSGFSAHLKRNTLAEGGSRSEGNSRSCEKEGSRELHCQILGF
jgi:hypothetical protein